MPQESTPRRERKRTVQQMVVVGVIATAIGIAIGLTIHWFPPADSTQADKIDTLWDVLIIATVPVFVLVTVIVSFAVIEFRMRPGEENLDGPPIHGNTRLEVIWTAIPAIILVGLCTYAFIVLEDVEAVEGRPMNVRVVGEQFAWTFFYQRDGKEVASNQLHVPINQQVKFTIQSKDVLHDFWVPAFRMKKDAVPGINVTYSVTPNRLGTYPIVCAELCGLGHAVMRSTAVVDTPQRFRSWLTALGRPAAGAGGAAGGGAGAADGKAVFTSATANCKACHTLADAGATGAIGPNLGTALKGKDPAFIKQSIVNPNADITPGFQGGIMPPNYEQTL